MPVWLDQVHGTHVLRLEGQPLADLRSNADYSCVPGAVCAVMTADCLAILFCSQAGYEVAAAHSCWLGLCNGVLEQTVAAFPAQPGNISAWLWSTIDPKQFVVGFEGRAAFIEGDSAAVAAFAPHGDKFLADINLLARQRLLRAGIQAVCGSGRCIFREISHFFFYRRYRRMGSLASLIWLI